MPETVEELKKRFKKLKRKLRQIERLRDIDARKERKLTSEERAKIESYPDIRAEKLEISAQLPRRPGAREGSSSHGNNGEDDDHDVVYDMDDNGEDLGEDIVEPTPAATKQEATVADISTALQGWTGTGSGANKTTSSRNTSTAPPATKKHVPSKVPSKPKQPAPSRPAVRKQELQSPGLASLPASWKPGRVWSQVLDEHNDIVRCVALEDTTCVTGSQDTSVKVWDLERGEVEKHIGAHSGAVTGLYYSASTCLVSASLDCSVKVWSGREGGWKLEREIYCYAPVLCLHSDTGKHAVVGLEDRTVRYIDLETGTIVKTFKGHEGKVYTVQLDSDKGEIISGSNDGSVLLWQLDTKSYVRDYQGHTGTVRACAFLGARSIIAGDDGYNLKVWERTAATTDSDMEVMRAERKLRVYADNSGPTECVYADNEIIVSTSRNFGIKGSHGTLHISSASAAAYAYTLVDTAAPMYLALAVDTKHGRIATGSSDGVARVYWLGREPKKPLPVAVKTFHSLHIDTVDTDSDDDESSDDE